MGNKGLPVAGYTEQSNERVEMVNCNKRIEENILRIIDGLQGSPDYDQRWLAIARTQIELGFMAFNRAIFCPARVPLPGDPSDG
jgi:hypothetical protein